MDFDARFSGASLVRWVSQVRKWKGVPKRSISLFGSSAFGWQKDRLLNLLQETLISRLGKIPEPLVLLVR